MKKRYILFNAIILVSSLIIFLLVSVFIVSTTNTRNMESEIKTYLSIIEQEYDGTNMDECANNIHDANKKLRVTFISSDGQVLYDTSGYSESNHLSRPEIKNVGKVTHRYSSTTKVNMFYVATYLPSSSEYIRVSMPETSITDMSNTLIWSGFSTIIVISIISFFAITIMTNKAIKPLKNEVSKLSLIVGDTPKYTGNDIDMLSFQIDKVRDLIEDKISSVENEKRKVDYIIENIRQGLVILDGSGQVIIINKMACDIFKKSKNDLLEKNYVYSFLNHELSSSIDKCMNENYSQNVDYKSGENEYIINVSTLDASFVNDTKKHGVVLFIYDITEQKKTEKIKTDFFANASHELKSPLTSIIGYQQMINQGIIEDKKEIDDAIEKTIKEATRMNQIITEMLELSKLEANRSEEKTNIPLSKAVEDIINSYDTIINNRNIKVIRNYSNFEVFISNNDLYHLLRNLIDNAIKYNKDNGQISITLNSIAKTFEISDTGIGIAPEHIDRIYERFYRVDKAKSKEKGGTGLGLAIVKHICTNNNLEIAVESELGKGTKFIIKF